MSPRFFRGDIPYEFRHLDTRNLFTQEEADQYMEDSDPPRIMEVTESLVWALDYIENNHPDRTQEDLEMISLYIDNGRVARVSYRHRTAEL